MKRLRKERTKKELSTPKRTEARTREKHGAPAEDKRSNAPLQPASASSKNMLIKMIIDDAPMFHDFLMGRDLNLEAFEKKSTRYKERIIREYIAEQASAEELEVFALEFIQ